MSSPRLLSLLYQSQDVVGCSLFPTSSQSDLSTSQVSQQAQPQVRSQEAVKEESLKVQIKKQLRTVKVLRRMMMIGIKS